MSQTRRLTAILAADVVGYSRLMGADEEGTLERLKALRGELVDPKIAEHHGRIVKTTGDGMLVEFASVVDAVRCAVEMQRAIVDRNLGEPEDQRIAFRIGVNLGDVIIDGEDIYGDGVNIAARLEGMAKAGGICISQVVLDQIRDKLPYQFEDMGEQTLKNIARPVRVAAMSATVLSSTSLPAVPAQPGPARLYIGLPRLLITASIVPVIGIVIAVWWAWPEATRPSVAVPTVSSQTAPAVAATPAPRLSIIVLPFTNLSNDPEQEYFADGITDDLTTDLSRISDSFVIAHNTALTYKGKPVDVKQVGRELGVRYVLEGSVRRAGDQVQVNAQLIDAESGAHVWADRFDTNRRNLAEAQNEITAPLVTDIDLSMDDRFLYVACWGTGEMRQYDVTDPRKPKLAGSVHVGGIARRTPHPSGKVYAGGPQMVEISRDGKRVYWTNSLYSTWDNQFYPDGVRGAEVMANASPSGGIELAKDYWVSFPDGYRAHQIRLEGGDCSTDSFCYPSV
jgi:adenylate cyclase